MLIVGQTPSFTADEIQLFKRLKTMTDYERRNIRLQFSYVGLSQWYGLNDVNMQFSQQAGNGLGLYAIVSYPVADAPTRVGFGYIYTAYNGQISFSQVKLG